MDSASQCLGRSSSSSFVGRRTGVSSWASLVWWGLASLSILRARNARKVVGKYVLPVIDAIGKEMSSATEQERRGLRGLREVMLPALVQPSVKQQTAIILARGREPLRPVKSKSACWRSLRANWCRTVAEVRTALKAVPSSYSRSGTVGSSDEWLVRGGVIR